MNGYQPGSARAHRPDRVKPLLFAALATAMLGGWPVTVFAHEYGQSPSVHRTHAPFPGPRHYLYLDELPATPANAQKYVTLAHQAMANCGHLPVATTEYRSAVSALHAKQYRNAMATSRNIVDDCATR